MSLSGRGQPPAFSKSTDAIRAELFSVERLEQHAESLAAAQSVSPNPGDAGAHAARLRENAKVLVASYRVIVQATRAHQAITPAAEWLLENFHIVEEQIREIEDDLPPGYYRRLPMLADGPLAGFPRVFGVAWDLVAHTDSAFDAEKLTRFVAAYQRVAPLSIGELWAIAITLRATLVENLRRMAQAIVARIHARAQADALADRILAADNRPAEPAESIRRSLDQVPWATAFAVQLALRLRDRDPAVTPALQWLNERLTAEQTTTDQMVRSEIERQAAANITVRNVITSMRLVSMIDWPEWVESVSLVDAALRDASNFAEMDFPTRDLYRRAIEDVSHRSAHDELGVTRLAIAAAAQARDTAERSALPQGPQGDPGYYLISKGRSAFDRQLKARVPIGRRLLRANAAAGVYGYVAVIAVVSAVVLAAGLLIPAHFGLGPWTIAALAVVGLIPASDVAIAVVNRVISRTVGAQILPGLELAKGVPDAFRTMLVVPTMLSGSAAIEAQIKRLEVHYLSNADSGIYFALLSDWTDSDSECSSADESLLCIAAEGIARLNQRYAATDAVDRFFLLHRPRLWNACEGKWIGWERKRGKLHELNRLLRGAADTSFLKPEDARSRPPTGIRYVITLDADTRMPIGAAKRLIGKMAHALNRPRFDARLGRVVDGHGILQPRVTPSLPIGREGSLYQRAFSGPDGLDPYAFAVSDVYQDLFEEGSFVGKGIYDVDAFEAAMEGRIPENTVLSHDLLEGVFARAALASDVEVVEEFPSRYDVAAARQHRWTRGDWQLLPWLFGRRPGGRGAMPAMGRWKLLDNLRRSLSAPTALLAFILGWLLPFGAAMAWTGYVLFTVILPPLLPALAALVPVRTHATLRNRLRALRGDLALGLLQSAFLVMFLAHQAWLMVDAATRALCRQFILRRHLLEWTTAEQSAEAERFGSRLWTEIGASAAFAALIGVPITLAGQGTWLIALPFAALWVFSPVSARLASRPPPVGGFLTVDKADAKALRLVARRTWRFFETFITAEDNMLPPDNFQEDPVPIVAHRTSPTNIGLYLLSTVAARDFGWIGTLETMDRLDATCASMDRLERFRGHLYNWYDTQDLRALEPKYVSSVDSGNLAGHLIALGNACREMAAGPAFPERWIDGLEDALNLTAESLGEHAQAGRPPALSNAIEKFAAQLTERPATPAEIVQRLDDLAAQADAIVTLAKASPGDPAGDVGIWVDALRATLRTHRRDLDLLMPWASLLAANPRLRAACPDLSTLTSVPNLADLPKLCERARQSLAGDRTVASDASATLLLALQQGEASSRALLTRLTAQADSCTAMFTAMDFSFLFDEARQLLSIGYRQEDGSLDASDYDLLASEARLASFIAIAKGDVPARHWFRLGRTLTPIDGGAGLISWSGSMFEYLMPSLVMRAPAGSLLEQTNRRVVRRQIEFGGELGIPWGMSESEYNARDMEQTYQYSSFGIPDLGYKRALGESTVIAPYATGLAAMVDPSAAAQNFKRLAELGARGEYGWYEAVDYTRSRLPDGVKFAIMRAYMAHHHAMSVVSVANALHDGAMRARFHREPIIEATELLLQERMPRDVALARPPPEQTTDAAESDTLIPGRQRHYVGAHSGVPRTLLLSNGRYSVMVTSAGSGYSRWRDVAVTRWREDTTRDDWGSYIYLRDLSSERVWSAGFQPSGSEPDTYDVVFSEDKAVIARDDGPIHTLTEIAVSPEDDAEVRRVCITNHGGEVKEIELTSYAEIALGRQADDLAHPAFAKLFVETEFVPALGAILATRRRRSDGDPQVWAAHLVVVEGEISTDVEFETDRSVFLGRGQTSRNPAALGGGWPFSNTVGPVLDAVFSLRQRVRVPPGATVRLAFWTLAAATREEIIALADKHHDAMAFERATMLAWTHAQIQLRHLGVSPGEAHLFQRLANHILFANPALRATPEVIRRGAAKASMLWALGISGDLPIVLVLVADDNDLDIVGQLLRAHDYWRLKQLPVDLVILNERAASYVQDLQGALDTMVRMHHDMPKTPAETRGAVFALRADLVAAELVDLLRAAARVVIRASGSHGSLADQIDRTRELSPPVTPPLWKSPRESVAQEHPPGPALEFFNGLGGFAADGREYVTILEGADRTPAPWINVIANPTLGFQVSTEGSGYTWADNSQQNQLTPWSNDAVGDPPGEALYLRDDQTGEVWTPTALPIRETGSRYTASHGQGFTRFGLAAHGVTLDLVQFVPIDDPIKISRLTVTNTSAVVRRLSVTAYVEWVLGTSRTATAPFVLTEIDPQTGAMFAQNPWSTEGGERIAFADLAGRQTAWSGDRAEFIGRDGALARPRGLAPGIQLSNRVGAGLDPCGALQCSLTIAPGASAEVVFFLGQAAGRPEAQALVAKYRATDLDVTFSTVAKQWDEVTGAVQVKTPDRALDILVNRWLPYQTLACRIWARTGFYQASGAYGFRDQLQDVMALCVSRPDLARAHILKAAARQFPEGDVQHWWLPETGRGIRTRVTDDRVWLAYVTAHYVQVTGDSAVLDERVAFLEGPTLAEGERDNFFQPTLSKSEASLFEHCALALDKSLTMGAHGLPLMGTGDWNDGMDRVGVGGKGESVWLGWFLCSALAAFAPIAEARGDVASARAWRDRVDALKRSLDDQAWDGDWYRRGYFDDGTPLGSASNSECRIDSIAQSWGVISEAADPAHAGRAMAALDKYLVSAADRLVLLFTPPFEVATPDPGYIKGYPPGVRENGGQYTHAAVWAAFAYAKLGDGDKAFEVLSLLNPIRHADSEAGVQRYMVEPYVISADVYSVAPHVGRGGWTWYTGSAGWFYRVALERVLGFRVQRDNLLIDPCIPRSWPGFEMTFRRGGARYDIGVENPQGVSRGVRSVTLDGNVISGDQAVIPLVDDGADHTVRVVLG
jgi:cyclic beta-1,2-glucan synthetase